MISPRPLYLLLLVALLSLNGLRADDTQSSKEARLREALKSAYEQLQTAQTQAVTLQAAAAESDKEKEALKNQVQALTDQLKAEMTKSALALQTAQGQINQFKLQNALQQRKMDEDERKNIALYQLANEILTRYENFSLGDALAAKEPFTSLTRTKLENLVQDYQDKLRVQRAGAGPATNGAPVAATAPAPANQ